MCTILPERRNIAFYLTWYKGSSESLASVIVRSSIRRKLFHKYTYRPNKQIKPHFHNVKDKTYVMDFIKAFLLFSGFDENGMIITNII